MNYQAPHEVTDQSKLSAMVAALGRGECLPPVLVCGERALTGSYRLAAWATAGIEPSVVQVADSDLAKAMKDCGLDPIYDEISDFHQIEQALIEMGY